MSLVELMPSVNSLPRHEKYRLAQNLLADLAGEETINLGEFTIYTPEFSPGVEAIMKKMLDDDKAARAISV